jgi:molybdenum cofactor sulfurtransferase
VEIGVRYLQTIGVEVIAERVRCLTGWLLDELLALRHSNGRAMVRTYRRATTEHRGGTVTFNLYDPQGQLLVYRRIEELAGEQGISLRTGCFCDQTRLTIGDVTFDIESCRIIRDGS